MIATIAAALLGGAAAPQLTVGAQVPAVLPPTVLFAQLERDKFIDFSGSDGFNPNPKSGSKSKKAEGMRPWVPVVAGGGALLVTGGVFYGMALGAEGSLRSGDRTIRSLADRDATVARGKLFEKIGWAGGGLGIAGIGAGIAMALMGNASEPTSSVSLVPTQGGAAFSLSGVLP